MPKINLYFTGLEEIFELWFSEDYKGKVEYVIEVTEEELVKLRVIRQQNDEAQVFLASLLARR